MNLPSGTVTFLFTDIEGSTRLWEQFPEQMRSALATHDALLHEAIAKHGGYVIKGLGDGFHAVFYTAHQALAAVLCAQQALHAEIWPRPVQIRARMALHTGEAEERDGDYYGAPVNRASRLMAIAHGGQVLISGVTKQLVAHSLPADTTLRSLGMHRLKDLSAPEHVWQLLHPSLPLEFPPLNSLDPACANLPIQPTSFIGRETAALRIEIGYNLGWGTGTSVPMPFSNASSY